MCVVSHNAFKYAKVPIDCGSRRAINAKCRGVERGYVWAGVVLACLLGTMFCAPNSAFAVGVHGRRYRGPAISVAIAKKKCFKKTIDVAGHLVPRQEVAIWPASEGYRVSRIFVDAGEIVTAGQVLARLVPPAGLKDADTAIASPTAGVVGKVSTVVGALTSFRAPPLFEIIKGGRVELLAKIPAGYLRNVSPGQAATVKVLGVGAVAGHVRVVLPTVNAETQFGAARVVVGNDRRLRVGDFGRASITVGQSCGMAIPISAVLYDKIGPIVEVVHDKRVVTRRVVVGVLSKGIVEIREGLSAGDMVVSRAGGFLRDGDVVRPAPARAATEMKDGQQSSVVGK